MTLLRKELREARWKLVVGTAILAALAVMLPLLYEMLKDLMGMIPGEQMERYSRLMPVNIFSDYSIYIWSQWNAKNLTQLGTIITILVGMNLIAGEISGQTMGFLLARPVSRRTVFLTKALAGSLILVTVVALSTLALVLTVQFVPYSFETGRFIVATIITTVGFLVILALTLFFSAVIDEPVKAGGFTVLVLIIMSVLGLFSRTRRLSVFTHMYATRYFLGGVFPLAEVFIMVMVAALLLGAGLYIFEKKEI